MQCRNKSKIEKITIQELLVLLINYWNTLSIFYKILSHEVFVIGIIQDEYK